MHHYLVGKIRSMNGSGEGPSGREPGRGSTRAAPHLSGPPKASSRLVLRSYG